MMTFITVLMVVTTIISVVMFVALFKILKKVNAMELDKVVDLSSSTSDDIVTEADLDKINELLDQMIDLGNKVDHFEKQHRAAEKTISRSLVKLALRCQQEDKKLKKHLIELSDQIDSKQ